MPDFQWGPAVAPEGPPHPQKLGTTRWVDFIDDISELPTVCCIEMEDLLQKKSENFLDTNEQVIPFSVAQITI